MDGRFEIIDAFVDGESVDPAALKRALAEDEGRDYLVDAWLLRDLVQDEIAADIAMPAPRAAAPARRSWLIAAALAGVCLAGGYVAGTRLPGLFGPGPTGTVPTEVSAPPPEPASFPVPAPTRVIRLEIDPNGKEAGGGR